MGHPEAVAVLLAAATPVHAANADGYLPLHFVAEYGQAEVVAALLAAAAPVGATSATVGVTPLDLAEMERPRGGDGAAGGGGACRCG